MSECIGGIEPREPAHLRTEIGRLAKVTAAALLACTLGACAELKHSDSGYEAAQWRRDAERRKRENEIALKVMQEATRDAPRGVLLEGAELTRLVAGKTLVYRYDMRPGGKRGPYIVQQYFGEDGGLFVVEDPPTDSNVGRDKFRWRVEESKLCILDVPLQPDYWKCYRMARTTDGQLQAYIAEPGSPFDGLLTVGPNEIFDGPPQPSRATK